MVNKHNHFVYFSHFHHFDCYNIHSFNSFDNVQIDFSLNLVNINEYLVRPVSLDHLVVVDFYAYFTHVNMQFDNDWIVRFFIVFVEHKLYHHHNLDCCNFLCTVFDYNYPVIIHRVVNFNF